jgi:uroporphyrin-III C-methyltransferase / precorrin-2 dehydrogenase / sirohydrochlorin ferrochelatase
VWPFHASSERGRPERWALLCARYSRLSGVDYFPVFMDLRERLCVLIGGGDVAARKAALLLRAGARLRVVAPTLGSALSELIAGAVACEHRARPYEAADLDGAALVVAATERREVNREVSEDAFARSLPINVVDDPELCSVIVPAIIDRSPIVIAVGTGGSAPVLARLLRANIEASVPVEYGALAALSARLRAEVQKQLPDVLSRRRFWEEVFEGEIAELSLRGELQLAEARLRAKLASCAEPAADGGEVSAPRGEVYLIGAGPNDPDLMSFRALRLLQRCDLVLCAPDLSEAVADLSRRDASRVRLRGWPPEIADVVARLAAAVHSGQRACVLAPRDAFRTESGRALEAAIHALQLPCVTVPGVA